MLWWMSRGYTPAGVEAWNGIRAIDYLLTRTEVDGSRIGVTGRSGGGAYSWWITALDERVKVSVPVAGITSLRNHIIDGCIEGHCDCMFMVNSSQWDFAEVAALVAPRKLLISNTDNDIIFPLDGVVDVYNKTRRIYKLLGVENNIGLHVTDGGHSDTQPLRMGAFHWFNKHLKGESSLVRTTAEKFFEPENLKVFTELPQDEITSTIHDIVPVASAPELQTILLLGNFEVINYLPSFAQQLSWDGLRKTPSTHRRNSSKTQFLMVFDFNNIPSLPGTISTSIIPNASRWS